MQEAITAFKDVIVKMDTQTTTLADVDAVLSNFPAQ